VIAQVELQKMVFRQTHRREGRHISVSPTNSPMRHLAYGRIILNQSKRAEAFSTGDRETGLVCLSGRGTVNIDDNAQPLGEYMRSIFHATPPCR
jgi:5-deoxy-D-glucuronate isomerase